MDIKNKLPIALIATIAILAGGGVLYLKIMPGPGKQLNVAKPQAEKKESLMPAEQAVKKVIESQLLSEEQIYRNATFREIKNDGYEAMVLADAEFKIEDKWFEQRAVGTAKKIGDTWKGDIELYFENKNLLRVWRDVEIFGVKEILALSPELLEDKKECGEMKVTRKYEALVEVENKGNIPHTIKFEMFANARGLKEGKCDQGEFLNLKSADIELRPKTRDIYYIKVEQDRFHSIPECCVFEGAELDTGYFGEGRIVRLLEVDGVEERRSDDRYTRSKWLKHPEYLP